MYHIQKLQQSLQWTEYKKIGKGLSCTTFRSGNIICNGWSITCNSGKSSIYSNNYN